MQRCAAQAQTEYVLLLFVSLGLIVGVTRYSDHVSRAYAGGAAALPDGDEEGAASRTPEMVLRVPGPMRVSTGAGEGTLTFLRRTSTGWAPLVVGDVITADMEFVLEVTFEDDPQVSSTAAYIGWAGTEPPPGDLSEVVVAGGRGAGGEGLAANVPVERISDGRYRSGPLRLSDVLARFQ